MACDIDKLEPFDILLFRPNHRLDVIGHLISFLSLGGSYSHASLYQGLGYIVESHFTTNVCRRVLKDSELENIDVFRLPSIKRLSKDDLSDLEDWYMSKLGSSYDLAAFPSTFFKSVITRLFGFRNFRKSRPLFNDENAWYCSEYVSQGFFEVLGINLYPGLHPMSQTPSDLSRGLLVRVS